MYRLYTDKIGQPLCSSRTLTVILANNTLPNTLPTKQQKAENTQNANVAVKAYQHKDITTHAHTNLAVEVGDGARPDEASSLAAEEGACAGRHTRVVLRGAR